MGPQTGCRVTAGTASVLSQAACSFRALSGSRSRSTQEGLAILLRGAIAEGTGKGPLAQWQSRGLLTLVSQVRSLHGPRSAWPTERRRGGRYTDPRCPRAGGAEGMYRAPIV